MKSKAKYLLEAVVTIAILASFVMPGAAITEKTSFMGTSHGVKPLPRAEWIEQATGFQTPSRGIVSISIVDNTTAWAGAYDGTNPNGPCTDYTITVDGGNTWTANSIPNEEGDSFSMIYALDANTAWALMWGTDPGVFKTTNGGSTWVHETAFNATSFPDCIHFFDANNGWCMGDPQLGSFEVYTTTDGGNTWTPVPNANIPAAQSGEYGYTTFSSVVGDTIWFGTNQGRVYRSTDRGYHWTVASTPFSTPVRPFFKDANNGLVVEALGSSNLAETTDGGLTWHSITFQGVCYNSDLCYVPGTTNMYISVGAAAGASGASYSPDGGHNWIDYDEVNGIQLTAVAFTTGMIGWAGSFNTDETTGGIWKHIQFAIPKPLFTIGVTGGKGLSVTINNIGNADATNVSCGISIADGLWIKQRTFTETKSLLATGANFSFTEKVMGIGLGILKSKPIPTITITVTCAENVNAIKTVSAKIFLSKVTLQ